MLRLGGNPSNEMLKLDADYMVILFLGSHIYSKNREQSELNELCERFLQKHGRQPWFEELEKVIHLYEISSGWL